MRWNKMVNKLRKISISIIEDIEEHINLCEQEEEKPFDKEAWYRIEDIIYDKLYQYLVGDEE